MLVKSIKLGNISFPSNLIQAPLAGVSAAPFRELIQHFGGAAYCCTEMISAKTVINNPPKRYILKSQTEGPLCFQLSGNQADELRRATEIALNYGADIIDLNSGCPVDKIRKKGCGSKLLAQSQNLMKLIQAIRSVSLVPVSAKIRIDGESSDSFNYDVVKAIVDAGADFIIVHGRHWTEHYETAVRLDQIAEIVDIATIPVIGNGDVQDYASLKKMIKTTHCQGVMIGRASVGCPWLFKELTLNDQGMKMKKIQPQEIGHLFLKHIKGLAAIDGEHLAVLQARKLSKYYLHTAQITLDLLEVFYKQNSLNEFQIAIQQNFK